MPKRKFDRALLDETLARDNASHDETKELPVRLNRDSRIPFKCACGTPDTQVFRRMVENGGARCKLCTESETKLKRKATMLENHSVENAMQSAEFRQKSKATCLENHGVEYSMQSAALRKKAKATCLENHGVENPSQSAEVKERKKATMMKKHGVEYPMQSAEVREKSKATMLENHGVENAMQSAAIREKAKATMLENHGVEYSMQSAEVREKSKATCLENHGVEYSMQSAEVREKAKATMLENHGVEHALQSAEFMEKAKTTMLENHGVEHALQNLEIFERQQKSAWKRKEDYTTPSGQVWTTLQGYEPLVAPKLIDEYGEDDITPDLKQVPCVWWTDSKGVRHKYYCDFYVKSRKLVIEVKGPWTETKDAEKIVATREAANALGYGYRLIVLDDKGVWTRDEFSPSILGAEGKKPVKE